MTDKHPNAGVEAAIERLLVTAKAQGPNGKPLDHGGHEMVMHDWLVAGLTDLLDLLRALPAQQPDVSELVDYSKEGEALAIKHGFTAAQYKAAKIIEYRIFGPYQWQNQGDRAASMFVQIMQAMKDNEEALGLQSQPQKADTCPICGGAGQRRDPEMMYTLTKCLKCNGTGQEQKEGSADKSPQSPS